MKYLGFMCILWGVGYFVAMFITVAGLPAPPCALLFAAGFLLIGIDKIREGSKDKPKNRSKR